jgi:hypothetical protein
VRYEKLQAMLLESMLRHSNILFNHYFVRYCYFHNTNEMMEKFTSVVGLFEVVNPHTHISTIYLIKQATDMSSAFAVFRNTGKELKCS